MPRTTENRINGTSAHRAGRDRADRDRADRDRADRDRADPTRPAVSSRGAATGVLLALVLMLATPATRAMAAPPDQTDAAASSLSWLARELDLNGGTMPGFTDGSTDWGLTADAVLAFAAAGRASDPAATRAAERIASAEAVSAYTTWEPAVSGVRVAGATAKTVLVLGAAGRSTTVTGTDLEQALRGLMIQTGDQRGRFDDQVPDPSWNTSNGFSQALAVLALASTTGGAPGEAVDFLVAQQCPAGGFRLGYEHGRGCSNDAVADVDATALAVQAMLSLPPPARPASSIDLATRWMMERQLPDGSFGGTGPTSAANANSTGLAAQALRAAGHDASADMAARWITEQLLLRDEIASASPSANHIGAIAYTPQARTAAVASGISASGIDQWRRATSQAVLALGLAPFGGIPVIAGTTTSTPATSTTATSTTATSTTATSTTATTSSSTTSSTSTTTTTSMPPALVDLTAPVVMGTDATRTTGHARSGEGRTASASDGPRPAPTESPSTAPLPRTGKDLQPLAALAAGLLVLGALAMVKGRSW